MCRRIKVCTHVISSKIGFLAGNVLHSGWDGWGGAAGGGGYYTESTGLHQSSALRSTESELRPPKLRLTQS